MATSRRITVTFTPDVLGVIDQLDRKRSRVVVEAIRQEIRRRRRDNLQRSIRNPHPETARMTEDRLIGWHARLADEGLVDGEGGTALRWAEGQGWIADA